MKLLQLLNAVVALCCLCLVAEAGAAAMVIVKPSPDGSIHYVSVANVVNASAIDFVINYDAAALSNPVVSDGKLVAEAAAIRELNMSKPGVLRVVYISVSGFKKSGELATISFSKKGSLQATAPKLESEVFSPDGPQVATRSVVTINTGADSTALSTTGEIRYSTDKPANDSRMSASPDNPRYTGYTADPDRSAVQQPVLKNEPFTEENKNEGRPQDLPSQSNVPVDDASMSMVDANAAGVKQVEADKKTGISVAGLKSVTSVIDRVQAYRGPRTLKGFSELFDDSKSIEVGLIQTPKIAVSDGKKNVTVNVSLSTDAGVPSFSLKGANLKGLKGLSDKLLELDVLPQKGKLDVRISIVMQKQVAEIPLLVVPPISGNILAQSDQVLEKLISKADDKNKLLLYDMNADGKQDYLDDYILVAHWLLKQESKKIPAAKAAAPH